MHALLQNSSAAYHELFVGSGHGATEDPLLVCPSICVGAAHRPPLLLPKTVSKQSFVISFFHLLPKTVSKIVSKHRIISKLPCQPYIDRYMHKGACTYICTHICTNVCTHVYACQLCMHMYVNVCTHVQVQLRRYICKSQSRFLFDLTSARPTATAKIR